MISAECPAARTGLLVAHASIYAVEGSFQGFNFHSHFGLVSNTAVLAILTDFQHHFTVASFLGDREPQGDHLDVLQTAAPPSSGAGGCGLRPDDLSSS